VFNKLMKELKENKFTTIVFLIFLGLFLIGALIFGLVMPKTGKPIYGNRLDGIEKVEVTKDQTNELVKNLKDKDYVTSASTHISGKIINVLIETKEGTSIKKAKTLKTIVLKAFEEDQKKFYDIQLFITNENKDAKGYPVIGYKNSSEKNFVF